MMNGLRQEISSFLKAKETAAADARQMAALQIACHFDLAEALKADPTLREFGGRVSDSGEGRWTLKAAVDTGVPAPVLASALFDRFSSQGKSEFADKLLSAMRYQFGGHVEKK